MKSLRTLILFMGVLLTLNLMATPPEKVGVLVLAHGGSDTWNQLVVEATQATRKSYPVEIAFGMALPRTIQEGITKLERQGVTKIVVVPLFVSSHSFIIRQTEYLLKKRHVLADPPLVMDHSNGSHHSANMVGNDHMNHNAHNSHSVTSGNHGSHGNHAEHTQAESTLPQLNFTAEIMITPALDDHPLVADILYSRIQELSTNPANETVILVGHGPNPEDDNRKWVANMESLAAQIQQKQKSAGKPARMVLSVTVRDDADQEIYEQAKEHLRGLVRQAGKQSKVIVVPLLLSQGGVEAGMVKRMEGLTYAWSGKTLLPDTRIQEFILQSVKQAIGK